MDRIGDMRVKIKLYSKCDYIICKCDIARGFPPCAAL
jgi:hypothetical protein